MSKKIYTTLSLLWSDYTDMDVDWEVPTNEGVEVLTARFVEHLQTILNEGRIADYVVVESDLDDIVEDEA